MSNKLIVVFSMSDTLVRIEIRSNIVIDVVVVTVTTVVMGINLLVVICVLALSDSVIVVVAVSGIISMVSVDTFEVIDVLDLSVIVIDELTVDVTTIVVLAEPWRVLLIGEGGLGALPRWRWRRWRRRRRSHGR